MAQWNGYFNALVYLNRQEQYPLQLILREILISSQMVQADIGDLDAIQEMQRIAATVKYGVIVVASVPMLMIYPLVQKYFVKGVMIGSVKAERLQIFSGNDMRRKFFPDDIEKKKEVISCVNFRPCYWPWCWHCPSPCLPLRWMCRFR